MNLLVGAGGWAYFGSLGSGSLEAYASAFKFVEINSTFYEYPDIRTVYSWRKRVHPGFEFSVRCHRDISRGLQSGGNTIASTLERMEPICDTLSANALAVLVPASVTVGEVTFRRRLEELVSTFHSSKTKVAGLDRERERLSGEKRGAPGKEYGHKVGRARAGSPGATRGVDSLIVW